MDAERKIETKIIDKLYKLLVQEKTSKRAFKGEMLKKTKFRGILDWYNADMPWALVTPDIILAYENYSKPDDVFLVAIEIKYFPSDMPETKSHWRRSFREIGQPLRNLIFGFDVVILWHIFSEETRDENVKKYAEIYSEIINGLKLPFVYFATRTIGDNFKFYQPWIFHNLQNIEYVSRCINQNQVARNHINPLLENRKVVERRRAIKNALNIP